MSFVLLRNSKGTLTSFSNLKHDLADTASTFKSKRIRNAKNLTFYESKSFVFELISFFSNCLSLLASIIYVLTPELFIDEDGDLNSFYLKGLNDYMVFTSVLAAFFYGLSEFLNIKMELENRGETISFDNFMNHLLPLLSLSLCQLITPNNILITHPLLEDGFETLTIFYLLFLIGYLRILFIYSFLVKTSQYFGSRVGRLLNIYGCENQATHIKYAIKCNFKEHGLISNFFLLLFATALLGTVSRILSDSEEGLYKIEAGIYSAMITLTTVGYGEVTPEEVIEKCIIIIIIVFGSFASSVCTLFFLESLQLTDRENKAYRIIKRLKLQQDVTNIKFQVIAKFIKGKREDQKNSPDSPMNQAVSHENSQSFGAPPGTVEQRLNFNEAIYQRSNVWREKEKFLKVDQQPLYELVLNEYIHFCGKLKSLVENQLLSDNLLTFYYQRNQRNCTEPSSKVQARVNKQFARKRVEDSSNLYQIKLRIIG